MVKVAFLDNTYPEPYQTSSIGDQALGGTESSIIRTANILSQQYQVKVAQKHRLDKVKESESLSFVPKSELTVFKPDVIVVLRKYPLIKEMRQQFPKAKLLLWLHTYKPWEFGFKRSGLAKTRTTVVCNSKTHAQTIEKRLNQGLMGLFFSTLKKVEVSYCYNPIPRPKLSNMVRNLNQLLFFSSPNKGLDQVLKCFEYVQKQIPELTLLIANPGYKGEKESINHPNVKIIGSLPHKQMMEKIAESLCVFYPQNKFAETFGLIYAEANAYGTPVLAHDVGAAKEILHENNTLIDTQSYDTVLEQIKSWKKKHPKVEYKSDFSESEILKQWKEVMGV